MIDVNDLNKLDCDKAQKALNDIISYRWLNNEENQQILQDLIDDVGGLQRKYTKPIAALLKGPNG